MKPRLSFSAAKTLRGCGEAYRLERVIKVQGRPNWSSISGTAFHSLVENIMLGEHGSLASPSSMAEFNADPARHVRAHMDAAVARELERSDNWTEEDIRPTGTRAKTVTASGGPNKADRAWMEYWLPSWVRGWDEWRRRSPWDLYLFDDGSPAVEVEFNVDMDGVGVKGFVDAIFRNRLSGELVAVDWKAGVRVPDSPEQLGTYRVGLWLEYGLDVNWGCYFMARKSETTHIHDLRSYTLERLGWQFNMLADRVEAGDYAPNYSSCHFCSVADWCYAVGGEKSADIPKPWEAYSHASS